MDAGKALEILLSVVGGLGLFLPMGLSGGLDHSSLIAVEKGIRFFILTSSAILAIYLISVGYSNPAGKESLLTILTGNFSITFYGGVLLLGILIPLLFSLFSYFTNSLSIPLLYTAMICELIGSFMLRYCMLKAGVYMPLIAKKNPIR